MRHELKRDLTVSDPKLFRIASDFIQGIKNRLHDGFEKVEFAVDTLASIIDPPAPVSRVTRSGAVQKPAAPKKKAPPKGKAKAKGKGSVADQPIVDPYGIGGAVLGDEVPERLEVEEEFEEL